MEKPEKNNEENTKSSSWENSCPVCGKDLIQEKCKVVCRSEKCVYRIIFNCSEF